MATTIINPASNNDSSSSGIALLIGVVAIIVVAVLFFIYGLPTLRGLTTNSGVQVNIPKNIEVNIKQPK